MSYQEKARFNRFQPAPLITLPARTEPLETPNIANDPFCHRHTVTLRGL